jgi:hypothetical protein
MHVWNDNSVMDSCGAQHGYLNEATERNKEYEGDAEDDIINPANFVDRLHQPLADAPHLLKACRSSEANNKVVLSGWWSGLCSCPCWKLVLVSVL